MRLVTRSGLDWTHRYGDLPDAFQALPTRDAIIDGEIVVPDERGISRFALLQEALSRGARSELVFYAFDLVRLDGWNLAAAPLERRKALLRQLLAGATGRSAIQFSDHVKGGGAAFYDQVSALGLEGVVSKRASAPYQPGRSKTWTKAKAKLTGDFVIAGFTLSDKAEGLAALALAEWVDGELVYRGKVGTGFDAATLADLHARLGPLEDRELALAGAPKDVHPVRPVLSARIQYSNITADGAVRHAVFMGLREVALEAAAPAPRQRLIAEADLATVWVTNPTRRLFGRSGPTKLDVAVYYAAVGDFMLPHLFGRPVSLVRCPTGDVQDCFFQRHKFLGMPAGIDSFETQTSDEEDRTYLTVATAKGYLALAQFGVIEFHAWGCRVADLEQPDRIVLDLDPGEGIAWREVVEAAQHVRAELAALGLVGFAKTTGGKGVHVVVPVTPKLDWKAVHAATAALAERITATAPDTFTTVMGATNRKRRIFIDFHRNARSATAVSPYSLRARNNLPASAPLSWKDLEKVDAPEDLNYSSLPGLVAGRAIPGPRSKTSPATFRRRGALGRDGARRDDMAPRASWKGYLKLSLVSCPVRLYPATSANERVRFNQLHKDTHNRINMKPVDPELGLVERSDLVKGYEYEDKKYIIIDDADLEAVKIESNHTLNIEAFVDADEVDVIYQDTPYYLAPDGAMAEETFIVLREAMREAGKVAIARLVLSSRERVVTIGARDKGMFVCTLRDPNEVRATATYFDEIPDEKPDAGDAAARRGADRAEGRRSSIRRPTRIATRRR